MTTVDQSPEFEDILRRHLPYAGPDPICADDRLVDLGLDSLGTVNLLLDIEEGCQVSFPDELLVGDTFTTAGSLWAVVERLTRREVL